MIEARGLHKSFGTVMALRGVSFTASDGQISGLLGPNGAGKTTTQRILYTLLQPDRGSALVDGLDTVKDTAEVRRRIGALPDNYGLYPRLTARENIRYYGRLHGLDSRTLDKRIDRLVATLDMQEIAGRKAQGFSHGERLKVAIARALVHEPKNLLLDEPTNGLDVTTTRAVRTVLQRLREEGKCILFSSHVMQEVAALCDNVIVIARGQVVARGTPDELRRATGKSSLEDAFVAAIGSEEGLM